MNFRNGLTGGRVFGFIEGVNSVVAPSGGCVKAWLGGNPAKLRTIARFSLCSQVSREHHDARRLPFWCAFDRQPVGQLLAVGALLRSLDTQRVEPEATPWLRKRLSLGEREKALL